MSGAMHAAWATAILCTPAAAGATEPPGAEFATFPAGRLATIVPPTSVLLPALRPLPSEGFGRRLSDAAEQPLRDAAARGDWAPALAALRAGSLSPHTQDVFGGTWLTLAASTGASEAVAALLRAGADPGRRGLGGLSPLALAVAGGHVATVTLLARAGADLHDAGGATLMPLHAAAQGNRLLMVQTLVSAGAEPARGDRQGRDALAVARRAGAVDTVRWLESKIEPRPAAAPSRRPAPPAVSPRSR